MMQYLEEILNTVKNLGPEGFCIIACLAVGYLVRLIPVIPNKWIPIICIVAGAGIYPFLTSAGRVSPDSQQPIVRMWLTGLILGVLTYVLHDKVIWHLETWLQQKFPLKGGGSTRYRKKADGSFEEVKPSTETKP